MSSDASQSSLETLTKTGVSSPKWGVRHSDIGPWGVTIHENKGSQIRDTTVLQASLGLVVGDSEALFEDIGDAKEIPLPSEVVLCGRTDLRERVRGTVVEPGSDEAEQSMYDPFGNEPTRYLLRWENVEAAVRALIDEDTEYDPEKFSLYDLGNQGFVLVREVSIGEPGGTHSVGDVAVLIAPTHEEASDPDP